MTSDRAPVRSTVDAAFVRRWLPLARTVARLLRARIDGLDTLPQDRPYLLVANHSGVFGLAELICLAALWFDRFGVGRPLVGAAHPLGFRLPWLAALHRRLGSVPSNRDDMQAALAAGVPVLVFPGGDHEAFRPIWQAGRVDFGGRHGFARVALAADVPIYPLAIVGSAWTAPVLWRSTWLLPRLWLVPHLTGVRRWPLTLLAVLGATLLWVALPTPWNVLGALAWLASPLAMLPWWPARITLRVGAPLELSPEPAATAREVEAAVQRLVALGHGRAEHLD